MSSSAKPDSARGSAIYSSPLLLRAFYDFFVLGITSTYIWRASTSKVLLPFFKARVSSNHLDIGVGTGYYLANIDFAPNASVALCDLNEDSLATAKSRIPQLKTTPCHHDIFEPLATREKFGSISLMYLLHCLPGPPERKAAIFGQVYIGAKTRSLAPVRRTKA